MEPELSSGSPRAPETVPDLVPVHDRVATAGPAPAGILCSCTALSLTSPAGEVIVVQVAGEVDLFTVEVLRTALIDSLSRTPCDLVVDLAAATYCHVSGLQLVMESGATAASAGIGFAVSSVPAQVSRLWTLLWPVEQLPTRFPSAAAAVLAAMAQQMTDENARWAPKRGPGQTRHWVVTGRR